MEKILCNRRGVVVITFAVILIALLGFSALAVEVGGWYLVRAELSKGVDAAAMIGAKNISNPYVSVTNLVQEFGRENFPLGTLGTPAAGSGAVAFQSTLSAGQKVMVTGNVSVTAILTKLFGVEQVATRSAGAGQKNDVEIMMVLDRSGSMANKPITDLKKAAKSFLQFFEETQGQDKMGLITFATGVTVDQILASNFVNSITSRINAMTATGATNAEDALDQSDGPQGFTDQSGVPGDRRVKQYMIFFTDGRPTAFTGRFRSNAIDYNAVVMGTGNTCTSVYNQMGYTNSEQFYPTSTLDPTRTGDGNKTSGSPLTNCGSRNTRWYIFGDAKYGLSGYNPLQCNISQNVLAPYICTTAKRMAIDHAQELKNKYIKIYTIGLGDVDQDFLGQVASGPDYEYYAPDSADLEAIFQKIAKEIKLRLVA